MRQSTGETNHPVWHYGPLDSPTLAPMRCIPLRVPEQVSAAVHAEAIRQARRPGDVLADWLRVTFPDFVRETMARDFAHPAAVGVIDVKDRPAPVKEPAP